MRTAEGNACRNAMSRWHPLNADIRTDRHQTHQCTKPGFWSLEKWVGKMEGKWREIGGKWGNGGGLWWVVVEENGTKMGE